MEAGLDAAVVQGGGQRADHRTDIIIPQTHPGKDIGSPAPNQSAQAAAPAPLLFYLTRRQEVLPPPPPLPRLPRESSEDVGVHGDDNHVSSICQTRTPEKAAGARAQPEAEPRIPPGAGRKSTL